MKIHETLVSWKESAMPRLILALTTLSLVVGAYTPARAQGGAEEVRYYHTDGIGSVRVITDQAGQVVANYDFLPFGERCGTACGTQAPPDTRMFAGKERDTETTFDYFGARYYAGGNGRFSVADPFFDIDASLVDPQHWNRYTYVGNNPLRYVDPFGLYQFEVACESGDLACLENQQRFRNALAAVRTAADRLDADSKERRELERILRYIGESEGGGAMIAFRDLPEGTLGYTNPLRGPLQFDVSAIDSYASVVTDVPGALYAAVVAHEGRHKVGGGFLRLNRTETASLFAESYVYQGLRANERLGPLWNNSWLALSPSVREANRTQGVREYPRR